MGVITWIILGLLAGFIASKIVNKHGEGLILDILLGIGGALVGGWIFTLLGASGVTGLNLYSLVVAVIGVAAAVAVPDYLHLRQDSNDDAAKTRLTRAARSLDVHQSSAGTFAGAGLPNGVKLHTARGSYCVETGVGDHVWHAARHAKPSSGACPR